MLIGDYNIIYSHFNASAHLDYTPEIKSVIFRADQDKLCVNFTLTVDNIFERPERFGVSFQITSDPDRAVPGGIVTTDVIILDGR